MYSDCFNGGCRRFKCSIPPLCIDLAEGACEGGCICIDKYTRDDNGKCIPEEKCPCKNSCFITLIKINWRRGTKCNCKRSRLWVRFPLKEIKYTYI